jgi:hypothetical protein
MEAGPTPSYTVLSPSVSPGWAIAVITSHCQALPKAAPYIAATELRSPFADLKVLTLSGLGLIFPHFLSLC